jgi:hypothetical protein
MQQELEGERTMETEVHHENGAMNGTETVPEVMMEAAEAAEWPEKAAQSKGKKSKTSSQARVAHLLDMLSEIDTKRIKLDAERDELKKQLAAAVSNL